MGASFGCQTDKTILDKYDLCLPHIDETDRTPPYRGCLLSHGYIRAPAPSGGREAFAENDSGSRFVRLTRTARGRRDRWVTTISSHKYYC